MFLDQGKEEKPISPSSFKTGENNENKSALNALYYIIVVLIILAVSFSIFYAYFYKPRSFNKPSSAIIKNRDNSAETNKATSSGNKLPSEYNLNNNNSFDPGAIINLKAEELSFGHFYEKWRDDFTPQPASYQLPINIKDDVANYYDVSRKFDLDDYLADLNNNGFAIAPNKFKREANNFFDFYRLLMQKDVPLVITSDFLIYYYHNNFKEVFKEIEKNAFYDNIWDISQKLYTIALTKYRKRLAEVGLSNDPILEGDRLELAYFAVALNLMQPKEKQIDRETKFNDNTKFAPQEAENYYFDMPDFLADDVNREVDLILSGQNKLQKSPVFLYKRNYIDFSVPKNYAKNAKLKNFYLALKWYNSIFPLYAKGPSCPDCLLDRDDWLINFIAACNIAEDISRNQNIKNEWAVVYKFMSFFSGLKRDLTYLHYDKILSEFFGKDYKIENIFSDDNKNRETDINNILSKLEAYKFSGIEGGDRRGFEAVQPFIGMRLLQKRYWPDDYIFDKLIGEDMVYLGSGAKHEFNKTKCLAPEEKDMYYRCSGFGQDIINLIYGLNSRDDNFLENTDYLNYAKRAEELKNEINKFDKFTWNNNIYWATLDIGRSLLDQKPAESPVYARSEKWSINKNINTLLGAWVNIKLPADNLVVYSEQKDSNLGVYADCNMNNYIEPNFSLVEELIVKNNMLIKIITALNISKETNAAAIQLKDLNNKLLSVLDIIKKELKNEPINKEDCRFIEDFASHYAVEDAGEKNFTISFRKYNRVESIAGLKILSLIYALDDKKIIALGPIFNYNEE